MIIGIAGAICAILAVCSRYLFAAKTTENHGVVAFKFFKTSSRSLSRSTSFRIMTATH